MVEEVEECIRREMQCLIEWCRMKFGEEKWEDASAAWVRPGEEVAEIGQNMVSGNAGWRQF